MTTLIQIEQVHKETFFCSNEGVSLYLKAWLLNKTSNASSSVALYAMQPIPMPLERCAAPDAFVLQPVPSSSLVLAKIGRSK